MIHQPRAPGRLVARGGWVAGESTCQRDGILVMLAAATRAHVNENPHHFDLTREDRRISNFGSGFHACPADKIAPLIAEMVVAHLLNAGVEFKHLR
jgi:cytochrome P450